MILQALAGHVFRGLVGILTHKLRPESGAGRPLFVPRSLAHCLNSSSSPNYSNLREG